MSMNRSMEPSRPLEPDYGRRMTNAEAVMLCRYARAACPQQKFDEYTPDAWADLLTDLRYVDCQAALKEIVKRQPFVSPSEIRDEVRRIRSKRIADFGILPSPPHDMSDEEQFAWQRDIMQRVGDGEPVTLPPAPLPAPMPPELAAQMQGFGKASGARERAIAEARASLRTRGEEDEPA